VEGVVLQQYHWFELVTVTFIGTFDFDLPLELEDGPEGEYQWVIGSSSHSLVEFDVI
jgi:hypothetical protein